MDGRETANLLWLTKLKPPRVSSNRYTVLSITYEVLDRKQMGEIRDFQSLRPMHLINKLKLFKKLTRSQLPRKRRADMQIATSPD